MARAAASRSNPPPPAAPRLLSLDVFQVYTSNSATIHTLADLQATNLIYDMGADNKVYLNYALESGSGSGDMLAYLPVSLFAGKENQYLYLYSRFGVTGGNYASNDGFEEWARLEGSPVTPPTVPESPTLLLVGGGLLALGCVRRFGHA